MHGIAFHLGPLTVHWYGIMVALGFLAGVSAMAWRRRFASMETEQIFDIALVAMVAGIVGARIFYVIQFWGEFRDNWAMIVRIDKGGLVFYGGFICAFAALALYCKRKKLETLKVLDLLAPSLALAHAFGRIGCFLQGCCYGKPSSVFWSVSFPSGTLPTARYPDVSRLGESGHTLCSLGLHPVQLYESSANFLLFAVLLLFQGKMKPGQLAAVYMVAYGVLRFVWEIFRGDSTDFLFGVLTPSQAISLFFTIPFGLILFVILGRRGKDVPA